MSAGICAVAYTPLCINPPERPDPSTFVALCDAYNQCLAHILLCHVGGNVLSFMRKSVKSIAKAVSFDRYALDAHISRVRRNCAVPTHPERVLDAPVISGDSEGKASYVRANAVSTTSTRCRISGDGDLWSCDDHGSQAHAYACAAVHKPSQRLSLYFFLTRGS